MQQPQNLIAAVLFQTISLRLEGRRVVTADLLVSEAIGPSPDCLLIAIELDGNEAARIIRSNWAQNDKRLGLGYSGETKFVISADRGRPNVERVQRLVGDPVLFNLNKATTALKHLKSIESWDAKLQVRLVHTLKVLVRAIHYNLVIDCAVSLGTLKTLNGVMQGGIRGLKHERLVRLDLWLLPATIVQIVVDLEHIVSLKGAECVDMVRAGLLLELFPLNELQVTGEECLFHRSEATTSAK